MMEGTLPKQLFNRADFAKSIRVKLANLNMSKKDAAKAIGISPSAMTRISNGAGPDVEHYLRISRWLAK